MFGLNIMITKDIAQKAKIIVRTIIYDEKFNENYVSTRLRLYGNLKTKLSIPHPPDPVSL